MRKTLLVFSIGVVGIGGAVFGADTTIDPYTVDGTNLKITKSSILPYSGVNELIVSTDKPKVTLSKWNGEVNLGVTYTDIPSNTRGTRPLLDKNVYWESANKTLEAKPIETSDGGVEVSVILNSKPSSNVFSFQLEGWQDLNFYYQAPLWQVAGLNNPTEQCGDNFCDVPGLHTVRAENLLGSYAVYHKTRKDHIEGKTNYGTGKVFHIYRPQSCDAKNVCVWDDMNINNGVLTVTVPRDFLKNATYPVIVDPTFGNTTAGANSNYIGTNSADTYRATAPTTGLISSVSCYFRAVASNPQYKGAMWVQSSKVLVTNAVGAAFNTSATGWLDSTFSSAASVTSGTDYLIGLVQKDNDSGTLYAYDTGGVNLREYDLSNSIDINNRVSKIEGFLTSIGLGTKLKREERTSPPLYQCE